MLYQNDYELINENFNQNEIDIISLDFDNNNYPNGFYSLGTEQNWNIFEPNLLYFILDEVALITGGKTGLTEKDSKILSKKIIIDKLQYSEKEINNIIQKMNIKNNNKIKLYLVLDSKDTVIEEIKYQLNPKIRIRRKTNNKILIKLKRGRKNKNDHTNANHNKYSSDNIIKAIKAKLNECIINFINKIINYVYSNNKEKLIKIIGGLNNNKKNKAKSKYIEVIKKLDYKTFVNKTNKKYNLELLNQTIKEYLSKNISKKYKNFNKEYNKIIIERLLQDEENNLIFNFIFNKIKIEDWLDIFVRKKELELHDDINDLKDYQIDMIKENLVRIDEIDTNGLYEMYENDKLYFHCFMLLIYNFKRFFELKEDRKEKRKLK